MKERLRLRMAEADSSTPSSDMPGHDDGEPRAQLSNTFLIGESRASKAVCTTQLCKWHIIHVSGILRFPTRAKHGTAASRARVMSSYLYENRYLRGVVFTCVSEFRSRVLSFSLLQ